MLHHEVPLLIDGGPKVGVGSVHLYSSDAFEAN